MLAGQHPHYNGGRDRTTYVLEGSTDGSGNLTLADSYDGTITVAGTTTQTFSGLPTGAKFYKALFQSAASTHRTPSSVTYDTSAGTIAIALSGAVASGRICVWVEVGMSDHS